MPEGPIGYVTTDSLRFRSSTNTENEENLIKYLPEGYALEVIEIADGWVHVKDMLNKDRDGNPQTPTGLEGYVSEEYFESE